MVFYSNIAYTAGPLLGGAIVSCFATQSVYLLMAGMMGVAAVLLSLIHISLVGLVLGDLQSGLAIGASLERLFMGSSSSGAYLPPDETIGGVLACAFAIQLGQSTEAAIALAMPIATLRCV